MLATTTREQTPLTKQLNTLTLWIVAAAGITMVVMFVLGAQRDQSSTVIFTSAVALAVAAIPEAMPTVLQVVMSLGAAELARRGAVLKDLASVETLGSTSAINSDKTGTLTMNQMTAVEVIDPTDRYTISGSGYELEGKVQRAAGSGDTIEDAILPYVIANDAKLVDGKVVGDPTEGALLVLAYKAGLDIEATRDRHPRLATLPFDPTYKLMATFTRLSDDGVRCYVKGAAPAVMSHAATALSGGQSVPWDEDLRSRAEADIRRMGEGGLRVMAAAYRDISGDSFDPTGDLLAYVEGLEMTSLVGMVDPPRAASKQAVHDAQKAHIRVRMVTGDDVVTGAAIAKQLNIEGEAILGAEFAALSEAERLERIDEIGVVGRVAPEHKVLLVDTLKQKGHVVAMTGDGVNDAPSIKAAHIGIAMGSGTEVAKNARSDDPHRRRLRDDRARGRAGAQALRQPHQVRPLRADLARRVRPHVPGRDSAEHRRRATVHASAGALDPLLHQRAVRRRTRPRPGHPGADAPAPEAQRPVDHDHRCEADRRSRRSVHGDLPGPPHLLRQAALPQRRHRLVDRADGVRADARRRCLREPRACRARCSRARRSTTPR